MQISAVRMARPDGEKKYVAVISHSALLKPLPSDTVLCAKWTHNQTYKSVAISNNKTYTACLS